MFFTEWFVQVHGKSIRVRWVRPDELPCERGKCPMILAKPCSREDVMSTCGRDIIFLTEETSNEAVRGFTLEAPDAQT